MYIQMCSFEMMIGKRSWKLTHGTAEQSRHPEPPQPRSQERCRSSAPGRPGPTGRAGQLCTAQTFTLPAPRPWASWGLALTLLYLTKLKIIS